MFTIIIIIIKALPKASLAVSLTSVESRQRRTAFCEGKISPKLVKDETTNCHRGIDCFQTDNEKHTDWPRPARLRDWAIMDELVTKLNSPKAEFRQQDNN